MSTDDEQRLALLQASDLFGDLDAAALVALAKQMRPHALAAGQVLFRQGDAGDALYLVASGRLEVVTSATDGVWHLVGRVGPGGCVGEAALLLEAPRAATVRAEQEVLLLELPGAVFRAAVADDAALRRVLGAMILRRLPRLRAATTELFGHMDAGLAAELEAELSWLRLQRGDYLFREGEQGDALYIVVHGRLDVLRERGGALEVRGQIGRDEPVGEMALLTGEPRAFSVRAARDSDLIRLTRSGFETLLERHPRAVLPVVRTLARRLRAVSDGAHAATRVRALAVITLDRGPRVDAFLAPFLARLREAGQVAWIPAAAFDAQHGTGAAAAQLDAPRTLSFSEWMGRQEEAHDFVIYHADDSSENWWRRCVGHSDRVLVLAEAHDRAGPQRLARLAAATAGHVPLELVLLHGDGVKLPSHTWRWLEAGNVARHYHVRAGNVEDARRVARYAAGCAVAVVLSGGGARGFAHAGVLRALRERGLPIDFIAGVSMGALAGAAWAAGFDQETTLRVFRGTFPKPGRGYTLPLVSIFSPRSGERSLQHAFGDTHIEDLWLNYTCVASNITRASLRVFRHGLVCRALRASGSFPGLLPPVPESGDLLVDGGLMTNLPIELARELCPGPIVASDVSREKELPIDPALEVAPTPGELLRSRFRRPGARLRFPGVASVLLRSVECREAAQRAARRGLAALYLTPPLHGYGLLDTDKVDAIVAAGHHYTREVLRDLPPGLRPELD